MRVALVVLFLLTQAVGIGQGHEALDQALAGLRNAAGDRARDSVNILVDHLLKTTLSSPEVWQLDFGGLAVSQAADPDGQMRIFTWNLPREDGSYHYHGYLLLREGRGHQLIRLADSGSVAPMRAVNSLEGKELAPEQWYGALYYACIPVRKGARMYYTLLGWRGESRVETRKVIDVIWTSGKRIRFGAPLFELPDLPSARHRKPAYRRVFGFNFQATMALGFEAEMGGILLDHLSPSSAELEGQWPFYGPDLSVDRYSWQKGIWRYERDVDARDKDRNGRQYNPPPKENRP
jgi:hypothetical protein